MIWFLKFLLAAGVLFLGALLLSIAVGLLLRWIAAGEADANGDVERDAGYTHAEWMAAAERDDQHPPL